MLADAAQKAHEIVDRARSEAQREGIELRRQALLEIKTILSRIEAVRAATDEELETQRIYANVAKIRAQSMSLVDPELQANGEREELVRDHLEKREPQEYLAEQAVGVVPDEPPRPSENASRVQGKSAEKPASVGRGDGKVKSAKPPGRR